jgi:ABC-type polysaccharide/polyol phosphate export permease
VSTSTPLAGPARGELLVTLVERQLRLRSKRSVFGVAWPLIAPLFLLALYLFVFGSVFEVPVDHYGVYLFAGLLPWTFLVQASHDALQSISFEPDLVRRAPMPYQYLPLARVAVMALPFLALLAGFVGYLVVAGPPAFRPALLPVLVLPVASVVLLVAAVCMLLALLDVFTRDLRYVLQNLFTVWFFLVPIVYSRRMVSGRMQTLTSVDPMRWIIAGFRDVLHEGRVDSWAMHAWTLLACAALFGIVLAVFRRLAVDLAKDV